MKNYTVSSEQVVYAMSKDNVPALRVESESHLYFETCDCFHGQITHSTQTIQSLDWERINPATGPVYIEGAMPGDILQVTIENIQLAPTGIVGVIPDVGVLGKGVIESELAILSIENGFIIFDDKRKLPVQPMIGVIGVAPASEKVSCGTPGNHGGNMDCTKITTGSTLYFPAFVEGALLAMGDVHACMGDGEVMGTGLETAATVSVSIEVLKKPAPPIPLLIHDNMLYALASAPSMEEATELAVRTVQEIVIEQTGLSKARTGMLLSLAGNLEVCQVVDPNVTLRFGIPIKYLQ